MWARPLPISMPCRTALSAHPQRRTLLVEVLLTSLQNSTRALDAAQTRTDGLVRHLEWHLAEQIDNAAHLGGLRAVPTAQRPDEGEPATVLALRRTLGQELAGIAGPEDE